MNLSLKIATLTQSKLIALRWLLKQTQTCQPQSGACISPTADHLLPPTHRIYRAALASRLRALSLAVTLGVSFFFAGSAVWANGCSGNTVISTNVTATQKLDLQLCSFTINNGISISTSDPVAYGIQSTGTTTALNNNGLISTLGPGAYGIYNTGTITTLNNNGSISTLGPTLGPGAYGIYNTGTITTLNNNGSISTLGFAADGIRNSGTITTLTNSGSISASGSDSFGINNLATITTLNNQQGKLSNNPLTYTGRLPASYNIIIAGSTSYGQLSIVGPSGTMIFGISGLSTTNSSVVGQTLTGVLQRFGSRLTDYISSGLTYSNGYTYAFTEQVVNDTGTGTWDLTITACSICTSGGSGGGGTTISNITAGTTVGLSALGTNPVLAGGTLVLIEVIAQASQSQSLAQAARFSSQPQALPPYLVCSRVRAG